MEELLGFPKMKKIHLYYINESSQKKRSQNIIHQLNKLSDVVEFQKVEAINATTAEKLKYDAISYVAYKNITENVRQDILPTWQSVGCALSHRLCWKKIIDNNLDYALICEDDIDIVNKIEFKFCIKNAINLYYNQINKPTYDMSFNSCNRDSLLIFINSKSKYSFSLSPIIHRFYDEFSGCSFYLISNSACKKLLNDIWPITYQLNKEIGNYYRQYQSIDIYNINTVAIKYKHDIESTIQPIQYLKADILINIFKLKLPECISKHIYNFIMDKEKTYYTD